MSLKARLLKLEAPISHARYEGDTPSELYKYMISLPVKRNPVSRIDITAKEAQAAFNRMIGWEV